MLVLKKEFYGVVQMQKWSKPYCILSKDIENWLIDNDIVYETKVTKRAFWWNTAVITFERPENELLFKLTWY